jgi:uncharacterized membrane protein YgcG
MRILLGCSSSHHRHLHRHRGDDAGDGLVPLCVSDPFWAMLPIIIIGPKPTVGLLALYLIAIRPRSCGSRAAVVREGRRGSEGEGSTTIGGMVISSGGSSSSGGSGGGGFSGGGGSSGGGGASGSW